MYVVRITVHDDKVDFKAFDQRAGAQDRYAKAEILCWRDEIESAALYEVRTESVRDAIAAVKAGDQAIVSLIAKVPDFPHVDLDELGL